jgi:LPS sulfotransferase NodH
VDRFALITTGRSGSHLIMQSLLDAGLSVEPELFSPHWFKDVNSINKLDILMPNQARLHKFLYYQIEELDILSYITNNFRLIHLTRNLIEVYISFRIAEQTGIWHRYEKEEFDYKLIVDLNDMSECLTYFNEKSNMYRKISEKEYSYLQITNEWDSFISEFLEYTGFPKVPIKKVFVKNFESSKAKVHNIEEVEKLCIEMGFEKEWQECA